MYYFNSYYGYLDQSSMESSSERSSWYYFFILVNISDTLERISFDFFRISLWFWMRVFVGRVELTFFWTEFILSRYFSKILS